MIFRYLFLHFTFLSETLVLIYVPFIHSFYWKYSQRHQYKLSTRLPIKIKLYFDFFYLHKKSVHIPFNKNRKISQFAMQII